MGILDNETNRERVYRQNLLGSNMKRTIPIMLIMVILLAGLFTFMYATGDKLGEYGLGNPYECMDCKKLGFACKEHRGFNIDNAIKEKIDRFSMNYIPDKSNTKYLLYGEGNEYNLDCDFCLTEGKECYGCEYNRLAIEEAAKEVYADGILESRLCSNDWKLGYADCNTDRVMMSKMIYNQLTKGE